MPNLLEETPEAKAWAEQIAIQHKNAPAFEKIAEAVIWADTIGSDGKLLVKANPSSLVLEINDKGLPLYRGHDPGSPSGKVLAARSFKSPKNVNFVAAILGFYGEARQIQFSDLGFDATPAASLPSKLQALDDDCWIQFATDPREVNAALTETLLQNAPLRVEKTPLSHNAADHLAELIRVGLPYVALVWNPFVKTIAEEAGKDTYAALHQWIRGLWSKFAELKNPILAIESYQNDCKVSFLFRGNDVKQNYDAHDQLAITAARAAELIAKMKNNGVAPKSLVYEFDSAASSWFPKYAILEDDRLVSDHKILIALEKLPRTLSLGLQQNRSVEE